jgi:hypothetical protein
MNRDDIIRMAREAGVYAAHTELTLMAGLERFAALVAAAEREACAKVAEQFGPNRPIVKARPSERIVGRWEGEQAASSSIADAIRARGKK